MDEYKEAQNEETSEPYYSEIVRSDNSNSGYNVIMKPNISYCTVQMGTTNSDGGESAVCTSCNPSIKSNNNDDKSITGL